MSQLTPNQVFLNRFFAPHIQTQWSEAEPPAVIGMLDPWDDWRTAPIPQVRKDSNGNNVRRNGILLREFVFLPRNLPPFNEIRSWAVEAYFRGHRDIEYDDLRAREPIGSVHLSDMGMSNRKARWCRKPLNARCWIVKGRGASKVLVAHVEQLSREQIRLNTTWIVLPNGIQQPGNPNRLLPQNHFLMVGQQEHQPSREVMEALYTLQQVRAMAIQRGLPNWRELPKNLQPGYSRVSKQKRAAATALVRGNAQFAPALLNPAIKTLHPSCPPASSTSHPPSRLPPRRNFPRQLGLTRSTGLYGLPRAPVAGTVPSGGVKLPASGENVDFDDEEDAIGEDDSLDAALWYRKPNGSEDMTEEEHENLLPNFFAASKNISGNKDRSLSITGQQNDLLSSSDATIDDLLDADAIMAVDFGQRQLLQEKDVTTNAAALGQTRKKTIRDGEKPKPREKSGDESGLYEELEPSEINETGEGNKRVQKNLMQKNIYNPYGRVGVLPQFAPMARKQELGEDSPFGPAPDIPPRTSVVPRRPRRLRVPLQPAPGIQRAFEQKQNIKRRLSPGDFQDNIIVGGSPNSGLISEAAQKKLRMLKSGPAEVPANPQRISKASAAKQPKAMVNYEKPIARPGRIAAAGQAVRSTPDSSPSSHTALNRPSYLPQEFSPYAPPAMESINPRPQQPSTGHSATFTKYHSPFLPAEQVPALRSRGAVYEPVQRMNTDAYNDDSDFMTEIVPMNPADSLYNQHGAYIGQAPSALLPASAPGISRTGVR